MDIGKEKASDEPDSKKPKLGDSPDSAEVNGNKLLPESTQSHSSAEVPPAKEGEEDARTVSSWASADSPTQEINIVSDWSSADEDYGNVDEPNREVSPVSSWSSADSSISEMNTISDWSSDDEDYELVRDPIPLMQLPLHLREEVLYKLDLPSKIEMKCAQSGMDEYMDRFITVKELQDRWDWMIDVFDELKSDGMREWPPDFDELRDWKVAMNDMKDYVAEKHQNMELKDWDDETTMSWEDWMEYQLENDPEQFLVDDDFDNDAFLYFGGNNYEYHYDPYDYWDDDY